MGTSNSQADRIESVNRFVKDLSEDLKRGLLRASARNPTSPGFWTVWERVRQYLPAMPDEESVISQEDLWATIVNGMSHIPHNSKVQVGQVLANEKYSNIRLNILLRVRGDGLVESIYRMVGVLKNAGVQSINWTQLADLMLSDGSSEDWRKNACRRIERDYYGSVK